MKKRLRKKLLLGEFQNWIFAMPLRYDPHISERFWWEELPDSIAHVMNAHGMFWGGGGVIGNDTFLFGFNAWPSAAEREAARQALADAVRELQHRFDFEFKIEPEKADLAKATARAPSAANRQRQINRRRGIEEMRWDD